MLYQLRKLLANYQIQAVIYLSCSAILYLSLLFYSHSDPCFNLATHKLPENMLGYFGAYLSDMLLQIFGRTAYIIPTILVFWTFNLAKNKYINLLWLKLVMALISTISLCTLCAQSESLDKNFLGQNLYQYLSSFEPVTSACLLLSSLLSFALAAELNFVKIKGLLLFYINYMKSRLIAVENIAAKANNIRPAHQKLNEFAITENRSTIIEEPAPVSYTRPVNQYEPTPAKTVTKQKTLLDSELIPSIELLNPPTKQSFEFESADELKAKAQDLLSVLADFGIKGQIVDINQGPVVTLYEFEPAAGTKSSRIIGLADDIARSLCALSTRIAVIPGRNVLGIELPNKQRAFFCLRELIETKEYQNSDNLLPLVLGKDIAGKPYIADLAKMPHLLVAGTTGSGKSVAINTMILSLLYRYSPQNCRFIMIDPKMLELSAYDGIAHLLTPVVTEPAKAVTALKWAVKEMENRYRLMSNIGVRNIANYNAKIAEYLENGKSLERSVHTGFDSETGKPIYENIEVNLNKLPFIVVIVDEMADLMIVAGKDIESSIQRLAQMARAAGIHIIMATQRPSVDVITGVIKANFPSRISFKVTSKIDSRTILGEQGSEQLLGMGDMLYMGSSSKVIRVHGPFVDDSEVERVTKDLREAGTPDYIPSVTEASGDEDLSNSEQFSNDDNDDEVIYKKAIQIIRLEKKVSISFVQRCLRIGYNRAANIIDRMEKENIISSPNHTGKREIIGLE